MIGMTMDADSIVRVVKRGAPPPAVDATLRAAWDQMVGTRGVPTLPVRRGRKPRVPVSQFVARPDLSCDAGRGHVGGPLVPVVSRAAGRQFVVQSAVTAAVGDLCRPGTAQFALSLRS